jgi:hypothetical protein
LKIFLFIITTPFLLGTSCSRTEPAPSAPTEQAYAAERTTGTEDLASPAESIRAEASRPNDGPAGMPLPLAAHWNTGTEPGGFDPAYQRRMVTGGHHLLPWFHMPTLDIHVDDPRWISYYDAPLKSCAAAKLPISFVGTQWEMLLSVEDRYLNLPPDDNPNVVGLDGVVRRQVSPFGPVKWWREVGQRWATTAVLKRLQSLYPDPPLVVFVSNNEHAKLPWKDVENDRRYLKLYGSGRDDDFKRQVVGDGWIERYRALEAGLREGLAEQGWRDRAIFIGYDAFGPPHFARWAGWMEHSLYRRGRIDPNVLAWDGGSPSFYTFNWAATTDFTVFSPQIESMNWVFMQSEAHRLNPRFWFEMSTWDGHQEGSDSDKRKAYANLGQTFSPERYGGMVQFGMWLLRPRAVREFRDYQDTLARSEAYYLPIVAAVDRIYSNATLQAFWRRGQLVANHNHQHPYETIVPPEYQSADRWFLLDTSLDPKWPWALDTKLQVFALALVEGRAPQRLWLIYAHAPTGARREVAIDIPDYKATRINVEVGGSFFVVDEKTGSVKPVS